MSVWFVIPSARPAREAQECIDAWRAMGYLVAIWRDIGADTVDCDYLRVGEYKGYARSVNALVADVMAYDTDAQWFVTGGDDTWPDQTKRAEVIASECLGHVSKTIEVTAMSDAYPKLLWLKSTFGVMQPTGDRWGAERGGTAYIDRVAGSPWLGREWCQRAHKGAGPLHPDFYHMFVDEALQGAAEKLGVFWQRPDLTHEHRHWGKTSKPKPAYIEKVNSPAHWHAAQQIFNRVKRGGFSECYPV